MAIPLNYLSKVGRWINRTPDNREAQTHMIGRLLLIVFAFAMIYTGYMASRNVVCAEGDCASDTFWAELFKTGFLLIGGAFTTVVGYYFGNAGADEARKQADFAKESALEAKQQADKLLEQANKLGEEIAPTKTEAAPSFEDAEIEDDVE